MGRNNRNLFCKHRLHIYTSHIALSLVSLLTWEINVWIFNHLYSLFLIREGVEDYHGGNQQRHKKTKEGISTPQLIKEYRLQLRNPHSAISTSRLLYDHVLFCTHLKAPLFLAQFSKEGLLISSKAVFWGTKIKRNQLALCLNMWKTANTVPKFKAFL